MMQIDQRENNYPIYQKEYSALYYNHLTPCKEHCFIQFQQKTQIFAKLPVAFIDTIGSQQIFYLLRWETIQEGNALLIRKLSDAQWIKISMNYHPERIAVTDNHIFLFGAQQLFIVSLISTNIKYVLLQNCKIIDLKLCYTHYNQPGVYVVYFNNKEGYYSKEYSKSYETNLWNKLKFILTVLSKQKSQYKYFQTILPNIFGIILNQDSLQIYDLNKMMPTSLKLKLEEGSIKAVRWNLIKSNIPEAEAIEIFVLMNNKIVRFILYVRKLQVQNFDKDISIKRIARGSIIDWEKTTFIKDNLGINSNFIITDFVVNNQCLLCFQEIQNGSSIPIINKVSLNDYINISSIITQQSSAWKQYYSEPQKAKNFISKFKYQIEQQKQIPNKNDPSTKKILKIEGVCLHYLNKFRNYSKFQQFIIFKGDVYIIRAHSITLLRSIPYLHYKIQKYSELDRRQDETLKLSLSLNSNNLIPSNKKHALSDYSKQPIQQQYKNIIDYLKKSIQYVQYNHQQAFSNIHQLPSKFVLLFNTFRDKFQYFYDFTSYVLKELKFNERSLKNNQIIRIIKYLHKCFDRHEDQFQVLSSNFLSLFIYKNQKELGVDVEVNIVVIVKKMFQNMLPQSFIIGRQKLRNNFSINEYFQFFIGLFGSGQPSVRHLIEIQLKQLISTLFPSLQNQTQSYLLSNISYIKAYFVSFRDQESELLSFCRYLTKLPNYKAIVQELQQIFHLIPNQLDVLIKAELQFKKNKICTTIFFNQQAQGKVVKSSDEQSNLQQLAHQILSSQIYSKNRGDQQRIQRQFYQQCILLGNKTYQTFQFEGNKLFTLCGQLYDIHKSKKTQSNIIELEEQMLRAFVNLFTSQFYKINSVTNDNFAKLQSFLSKLLIRIDIGFQSYKRQFKKHFGFDKREDPICNFNGIAKRINQQQGLMYSQFMDQPIKLLNHPLNSIFIEAVRKIIDSQSLLKLAAQHRFDWGSDQFVHELLKELFSPSKIRYEQMDLIYYCFIKKGQRFIKRFISKIYKDAPSKIVNYLEPIDKNDILYFLSSELVSDHSKNIKDQSANRTN